MSALVFPAWSRAEEPSRLIANLSAGKSQVVVAYGTSLTEGGAWVEQIEKAINARYPGLLTVINSGGSGQWSQWGLQNIDEKVIAKEPDTVFLEFSINDSVERFHASVDVARKNLETMIDRILKANPACEIILMTMTPGNKHPKGHRSYRKDIEDHYAMYRDVAKKHDLLLIDHYINWQKLQAENESLFLEYVPDTIHPKAHGCAEVVTPVILKALGLAQR
jgi:acyl-CoA thioesterase-1